MSHAQLFSESETTYSIPLSHAQLFSESETTYSIPLFHAGDTAE
ncbi:hypothetical protein [Mycobacterium canetti]|nr:hypothetical protein [Mycobacterium canetti]